MYNEIIYLIILFLYKNKLHKKIIIYIFIYEKYKIT